MFDDIVHGVTEILNLSAHRLARDEQEDMIVDTSWTSDTAKYETAISHTDYADGKWIIVEEYEDKDSALEGHKSWIEQMKQEPEQLVHKSNSWTAHRRDDIEENWRTVPRRGGS